jgi:hypothetical protein
MGHERLNMGNTRVMVEFEISGEKFSPDEITMLLGISPTETRIKGNTITVKNIINKSTIWLYSTGYKESLDVDIQLKQIVDVFSEKIPILKDIKTRFNVKMGICVVIKVENKEPPAMSFRHWFLKFLTDIDADVDFDMYVL